MESKNNKITDIIKAAFPHTVPVLAGFLFLGFAFGVLMQSKGYNFIWSGFMSAIVYAGSMQFVMVGLLAEGVNLLRAFLLTLMVNARHIFYGFSMLEKFKDTGKAKPYLVLSMSDETFSLLVSAKPPAGMSKTAFYFAIASLNHLYWILGSVIGGVVGSQITFNVQGIDFAMTALFVSILVEKLREKENRLPAVIGLAGSTLCLLLFKADNFILPAMAVLVFSLTLFRKKIEKGEEVQ